jgi:replication factor C subunit 1
MPVDIRNFFQKVPSSKKKDTAGKTASVTQKAKAPISSSSASSTTTTAKAKRRQVVPAQEKAVPKKAAPKKAPATDEILIGSDTDEEEDKVVVTKSTSRTNSKPSADSKATAADKATSPGKRKRVIIDSDDNDDDEVLVVAPPPSSPPKETSNSLEAKPAASPSKKLKSAEVVRSKASSPIKQSSPVKKASPLKRVSPLKKAPPAKAPKKSLAPADTAAISSFSAAEAASECLSGLTFCVTAVDPDWSRDEATDYLKGLGARVTGAVSGRTDYLLVLGEILEDDRPYTEGSKYKKATETGTRVMVGRAALHGVVKYHSDQQGGGVVQAPPASVPLTVPVAASSVAASSVAASSVAASSVAASSVAASSVARAAPAAAAPKVVVKNPYARKISNPYARKATGGEPKAAAAATSNSYASQKPAATPSAPVQSSPSDANTLWVDKYKPVTTRDILGNAESVRKLTSWLSTWEANFNKDDKVGKAFSNPRGPWKAALLSGPPGIGSKCFCFSMTALVMWGPSVDLTNLCICFVRQKPQRRR